MRFEWDEEKRLINLQKHGFDFADIWQIFDFDIVTEIDNRFDYGEVRYLTFGLLRDTVITIAHKENDDLFRIITVRKAEIYEQEIYFDKIRN